MPQLDYDPQQIRPRDMWASTEAQEMAQVGPEQQAEFVLQYEKRLLEPFGLAGYGCCEDLTHKLDRVFGIPHLRRISISPFADVDTCAARLQGAISFTGSHAHRTWLASSTKARSVDTSGTRSRSRKHTDAC